MSKSTTVESTVKAVEVKAEPVAATTPAIHLLPLSIARLADHAGDSRSRFALNGVQLEFGPENVFSATVTDTKVLIHVEGECGDPQEYPDLPQLASASNGATSALIPASVWADSFRKARTLTRKSRQSALKSLAVVTGPASTTLAATDLEKTQCDSTPNIAGRFPPFQDIIDKTAKSGQHTLKFAVDPAMVARLLSTIADYNDADSTRVEFEIHFDLPEPAETDEPAVDEATGLLIVPTPEPIQFDKPILIRAQNQHSRLTGIMMPLAF